MWMVLLFCVLTEFCSINEHANSVNAKMSSPNLPSFAIVEVVQWVQRWHYYSSSTSFHTPTLQTVWKQQKTTSEEEVKQAVAASFDRRVIAAPLKSDASNRNSSGQSKNVLEFLDSLGQGSIVTYALKLQECGNRKALTNGKQVHHHIVESGLKADVYLGNHLILMYAKCESLIDARKVFDQMPFRNMVSWNAMIGGYVQCEHAEEAFELFQQMQLDGMKPNKITFLSILKACSNIGDIAVGKQLHAQIVDGGLESDVVVSNALVNMYGKCGSIKDARKMFEKMHEKDSISWNSIVAAYVQHGIFEEAFKLFQQMQQEGLQPSKIVFVSMLNACACRENLTLGKLMHAHIFDSGFEADVIVGNALVNMYTKCGNISYAREIFDMMPIRNVITWTVMISGYSKYGFSREAFILFQEMQKAGVKPDKVTFISILNACTTPEVHAVGRLIHACIVDRGFESDVIVGTMLVYMYGKCGSVGDAHRMFDKLPGRNVVSWNVIIAVYAQYTFGEEAFKLFQQMQLEGVESDSITFVNILNSCASTEDLVLGKLVHGHIIDRGLESDDVVATALMNMYGKCGSIKDVHRMFERVPKEDVVSWSAMIAAYGRHGLGEQALQIFQEMQGKCVNPDEITWINVLNACSHAGFMDSGLYYFNTMVQDHGIVPSMDHYNCIVDLLGRVGQLDMAEHFIMKMPFQPDSVIWMTLLSSCRIHGCIDQGKHAAEHALQLDPQLASAYVVLANMYAAAGRQNDAVDVQNLMTVFNERAGG